MSGGLRRVLEAGSLALLLAVSGAAQADQISFLHTPPAVVDEGEPIKISGNIFGGEDLRRAQVFYRKPGGRWSKVELRTGGGREYEAIIPSRVVKPPAVEYYVVATDTLGNRIEIFAAESHPQRIAVGDANLIAPEETPPPKRVITPEPAATPDAGGATLAVAPDAGPPAPVAPPLASTAAEDDQATTYGAEDVVSLATRHEQSVSDAPAMANSLPQEDMRAMNARIVPDALKMLPGFETSRDVQGFYDVAVRGLRSDPELLVMYDGHVLNNPYDGKALIELSTENLERVEAIRGPGSALYGPGAFLGVVNLVPVKRDEITASASGDLFTTFEGDVAAGSTWGDLGLHGDGSVIQSGGYKAPIQSDNFTADLQTPLPNSGTVLLSPTQPAGYTNDRHFLTNVGGEGDLSVGGGHLSLSARGIYEDRGALIGMFDTIGPNSDLSWGIGMADLRYDHPLGSFGTFTARLYGDVQSVDRLFQVSPDDPQFYVGGALTGNSGGMQERTSFTTLTYGGEVTAELAPWDSNHLTIGLSASEQEMPSYNFSTNYTVDINGNATFLNGLQTNPLAGSQNSLDINHRFEGGIFLQDQWRPVKPLAFVVGLREDVIQLPTTITESNGQTALTGNSLVGSFSPRVGVVINATSSLSFKALYGHAFRPTMAELSDTSALADFTEGRPTGTQTLKSPTVDTGEAGVEEVASIPQGKVRLRANVFWNRFTNPIVAIDLNGDQVPLLNSNPGFDVKGAEVEARFDASVRAGAFMNYSWFRATNLAAIAPEFSLITDVPQYKVNVGLQVPVGPFLNLDLLTQLGAARENEVLSPLQALTPWNIPPYALMMVQVRTEVLFGHWELALSGTNVLQTSYQDDVPRPDRIPGLIPEPGFDAMLIVRSRW